MEVETTQDHPEPRGYNKALISMASFGKVSTSFVQRQLGIGYNAASEIIERMEANGVISAPNHAGKRKFLIDTADAKLQQRTEVEETAAESAMEKALGHNSDAAQATIVSDSLLNETARQKLRLTIQRIESLEEEKKEIAEQVKEVYGEAKALGYDTKALRACIRLRKQDRTERQEHEAILEVYMDALGEL